MPRFRRIATLLLAPALVFIGGCGSPTFDATSRETAEASMKRMTSGLSDEEKKQFDKDCLTVAMPGRTVGAFRQAFSKDTPTPTSDPEAFKPLQGLTVDQIRAKAGELRQALETNKKVESYKAMALARERSAVEKAAIEGVREAASNSKRFGAGGEAKVTVAPSWIKAQDGHSWDVKGEYLGSDPEGKKVRSDWTAKVVLVSNKFGCEDVEFGEPKPAE